MLKPQQAKSGPLRLCLHIIEARLPFIQQYVTLCLFLIKMVNKIYCICELFSLFALNQSGRATDWRKHARKMTGL